MSSRETPGPLHPEPTRRSGYRYFFYDKHHGRGGPDDAQWAEDLTQNEEFAIFDRADQHDLSDEKGNLYGLRLGLDQEVLTLGTWGQQVAEFPQAHPGHPWHGYPLWPLSKAGEGSRNPRKIPAPKIALLKMERARLLSPRDRKRLQKGNHV